MATVLTDHGRALAVEDGRRRVAFARRIRSGGWLMKGYALCWVGKPRRAGGLPDDPRLWHVASKARARALLKDLASKD